MWKKYAQVDRELGHKRNFNKFQRITYAISTMFFRYNPIKLEFKYKREIEKFLEPNGNENISP